MQHAQRWQRWQGREWRSMCCCRPCPCVAVVHRSTSPEGAQRGPAAASKKQSLCSSCCQGPPGAPASASPSARLAAHCVARRAVRVAPLRSTPASSSATAATKPVLPSPPSSPPPEPPAPTMPPTAADPVEAAARQAIETEARMLDDPAPPPPFALPPPLATDLLDPDTMQPLSAVARSLARGEATRARDGGKADAGKGRRAAQQGRGLSDLDSLANMLDRLVAPVVSPVVTLSKAQTMEPPKGIEEAKAEELYFDPSRRLLLVRSPVAHPGLLAPPGARSTAAAAAAAARRLCRAGFLARLGVWVDARSGGRDLVSEPWELKRQVERRLLQIARPPENSTVPSSRPAAASRPITSPSQVEVVRLVPGLDSAGGWSCHPWNRDHVQDPDESVESSQAGTWHTIDALVLATAHSQPAVKETSSPPNPTRSNTTVKSSNGKEDTSPASSGEGFWTNQALALWSDFTSRLDQLPLTRKSSTAGASSIRIGLVVGDGPQQSPTATVQHASMVLLEQRASASSKLRASSRLGIDSAGGMLALL